MKKKDVRNWLVMAHQCATCPLRQDEQGRYPDEGLAQMVIVRGMTEVSQICHHPRMHGKPETHLCRGARDFQLQLFHRPGFLSEPTPEGLAMTAVLVKDRYDLDCK